MLNNAWQPTKLVLYWPNTRCPLDKFDSDEFWGWIWYLQDYFKVTNIYKTYFIGLLENFNRLIPLQRRLLLMIGSIKGISLNYFTFMSCMSNNSTIWRLMSYFSPNCNSSLDFMSDSLNDLDHVKSQPI
jgi:hypothetical protein